MSRVKNIFSIKDLENLSGIKAHTIRIWEKRYNVLEPMRTESNIRYYDLLSLQKLLNITLLHNHGYKISKISELPDGRIPQMVREIASHRNAGNHALNSFKLAMMNFDQHLFFSTYDNLLSEKTFPETFREVLLPLIDEVGLLWQTGTISPAHEHFISSLIKQKILLNTEKIQVKAPENHNRVFVSFLPMSEIHDLGLLYLNYEIIQRGYKSIFLGECLPLKDLADIKNYFDNITFVTYFTVNPGISELNEYIENLTNEVLDKKTGLIAMGRATCHFDTKKLSPKITILQSIDAFIDTISQ